MQFVSTFRPDPGLFRKKLLVYKKLHTKRFIVNNPLLTNSFMTNAYLSSNIWRVLEDKYKYSSVHSTPMLSLQHIWNVMFICPKCQKNILQRTIAKYWNGVRIKVLAWRVCVLVWSILRYVKYIETVSFNHYRIIYHLIRRRFVQLTCLKMISNKLIHDELYDKVSYLFSISR